MSFCLEVTSCSEVAAVSLCRLVELSSFVLNPRIDNMELFVAAAVSVTSSAVIYLRKKKVGLSSDEALQRLIAKHWAWRLEANPEVRVHSFCSQSIAYLL